MYFTIVYNCIVTISILLVVVCTVDYIFCLKPDFFVIYWYNTEVSQNYNLVFGDECNKIATNI